MKKINLIYFLMMFFFIISCPSSSINEVKTLTEYFIPQYNMITPVDSIGDAGLFSSIVSAGSIIYISYYDESNTALKFAKFTDQGPVSPLLSFKTVDSAGDVGWDTYLAVSGSYVYISYYDSTNQDLKFARSDDKGISWLSSDIKIVDSAGDVGWDTSIAVSGTNVYISYYDNTNQDLKFAKSTDNGATWLPSDIRTVDSSAPDIGWYTSIAVSGSNIYITYFDATNNDLKIAKSVDSGVTWLPANIKIIDSAGDVGRDSSAAVSGSNVFISYFDNTNKDLKFAKSTDGGSSWLPANIKTVDYSGFVGSKTSLILSGSNIYISYYDISNFDLKFVKSTDSGATWPVSNIKTVDSTGNVGDYTSISVSSSNVYISYYDLTNKDLKFAKSTNNGNSWEF